MKHTESNLALSTYALIIGVGDYSQFDAGRGNPRGSSDLPSSLHDVEATVRLCAALGIPGTNIHVLASPWRSPESLASTGIRPGYCGEATRSEIEQQVAWLAGVLDNDLAEGLSGLLTFSGRGDLAEGELALCPSDAKPAPGAATTDDLENLLTYQHLGELVGDHPGVADRLTVLLDVSHAALPRHWRPGDRATLTGRGATPETKVRAIGGRMITPGPAGVMSRHGRYDIADNGALTWSFTKVLEGHARAVSGEDKPRVINASDFVARSQGLLQGVSLPQHTSLVSRSGLEHQAFPLVNQAVWFYQLVLPRDIVLHPYQLDPSQIFALYDLEMFYDLNGLPAGQPAKGTVLAVSKDSPDYNGTVYKAGEEYWDLGEILGKLDLGAKATSFVFTRTSEGPWDPNNPPTNAQLTQLAPTRVTWIADPGTDTSTAWLYDKANTLVPAAGFRPGRDANQNPTASWRVETVGQPSFGTFAISGPGRTFKLPKMPAVSGGSTWIPKP